MEGSKLKVFIVCVFTVLELFTLSHALSCDTKSNYSVQLGDTKASLVYIFFNQECSLFDKYNPDVDSIQVNQTICIPPEMEDYSDDYSSGDCYDEDCYGPASAPSAEPAEDFSQGLAFAPIFPVKFLNKYSRFTSLGFCSENNVSVWKYPKELDWRKLDKVQNIKDQGSCAACWAFSTTSALESAYAIVNDVSGTSVDLSEQQLIDCNSGCKGGWTADGMEYIGKGGGLSTSDLYPYSKTTHDDGNPTTCKASRKLLQLFNPDYNIKMYETVNFQGALGLVLALQQQPVIVNINGGWRSFQSYTNGIYNDIECSPYSIDHSVVVVGYNFTPSTPYWILRNSWGENWGIGGYMNMAITGGLGVCGIQSMPGLYPVMSDSNPCGKINPCGGGECTVTNALGFKSNKCKCPPTFVAVKNIDGSESCTPASVCTSFLKNPCRIGTCLDDGLGSYKCICPFRFKEGTFTDGTATCVPALLDITTTLQTYTVKEGDTCYLIANQFGLTQDELIAKNKKLNCNALVEDLELNVSPSKDYKECAVSYSVNYNDTCDSIVDYFSLTSNTFSDLNRGVDCSSLVPGQQVCVKEGTSFGIPLCTKHQLVYPGDTCQDIMDAYTIKPIEFFKINPGIYCDNFASYNSTGLPGGQVCVDAIPPGKCKCKRKYTVREDDRPQAIIRKYFERNCKTFQKLNCKRSCAQSMRVGEVLCLIP